MKLKQNAVTNAKTCQIRMLSIKVSQIVTHISIVIIKILSARTFMSAVSIILLHRGCLANIVS